MPFVNTKTTVEISSQKEIAIKEKFGAAIKNLGKSESWLMLNFEDNCRMYFKGDCSKPMAILEVSLFGKASDSQYDAMTKALTEIMENELGIDGSCVYIKYSEIDHWGYSGFNF